MAWRWLYFDGIKKTITVAAEKELRRRTRRAPVLSLEDRIQLLVDCSVLTRHADHGGVEDRGGWDLNYFHHSPSAAAGHIPRQSSSME